MLNNISVSLQEKNIYALMGANGSGKTTLFNLITGFIKPQSGEIYFKDINITKLSPYKINQTGIGRTFQDLRLISKLTVKENIILAMHNNPTGDWMKSLLPSSYYKKDLKNLESCADAIIEDYFLNDVKDSLACEISYGQQKLLNLACCVANGSSLLLFDEPLAGVNEAYREMLQKKIVFLKGQGKTIIMIDHHMDFIEQVADRIFFLQEGKLYEFGSLNELKTEPQLTETYFV